MTFVYQPPPKPKFHLCHPPWTVTDRGGDYRPTVRPGAIRKTVWKCECGKTWRAGWFYWHRESKRRRRNREARYDGK